MVFGSTLPSLITPLHCMCFQNIVHGVGTHGAYPQCGKDPVVLGSQIVMALQTLVLRELAPKEPGVVTIGAFR